MTSGRKPTKVHSFDRYGKIKHTYLSLQEASDDLGMPPMAIKSAILRKAYTRLGCYFGRSIHFEVPKKKSNFNPLFAKGAGMVGKDKSKRRQSTQSHKSKESQFRQ